MWFEERVHVWTCCTSCKSIIYSRHRVFLCCSLSQASLVPVLQLSVTPSGSSVLTLDLCESHEQFKTVRFWFILANILLRHWSCRMKLSAKPPDMPLFIHPLLSISCKCENNGDNSNLQHLGLKAEHPPAGFGLRSLEQQHLSFIMVEIYFSLKR